jgi:hypothetical protein
VERPSGKIGEVLFTRWPNPDVPTVAIGRPPFSRGEAKRKVVIEAMKETLAPLDLTAKAKLLSEAGPGSKRQRNRHC